MFPRRLYGRLRKRLADLIDAEARVLGARARVEDLQKLLADAQAQQRTAEASLARARQSWDDELQTIAGERPELQARLPLPASDPGFRSDAVELRVA